MNAALRVACVQLTPGADRPSGVLAAIEGIRSAAAQGADLVTLPEYATQLHTNGKVMRESAGHGAGDSALSMLRAAARECSCWVLIGSLPVQGDGDKLFNRSCLIDSGGTVVATYDKLHMFEATLPSGRVIREANLYDPGSRAVVVDTPWCRLGLTVCYDVRFPQLYRALAQAGAEVIVVPSAFTSATGELHWHALLRARAIENGCFIVAPATCGTHPEGHATYGHSLVVDPFGAVVMDGGTEPGVLLASLELSQVTLARNRIPSLLHDRVFEVETIAAAALEGA